MGDLIKDLQNGAGAGAKGSWHSHSGSVLPLHNASRSRLPITTRLSMSVDSVVPYTDTYDGEESREGSRELLHSNSRFGPDTDAEGSVNNILDALHDGSYLAKTASGSWSALLDPQLYDDNNGGPSSGAAFRPLRPTPMPKPVSPTAAFTFPLSLPSFSTRMDTNATLLHQLRSTLRSRYTKSVEDWLQCCPTYYRKCFCGPPSSPEEIEPSLEPVAVPHPITTTPSTPGAGHTASPFTTALPGPSLLQQQRQSCWLHGPPGSGKTAHCMAVIQKWVQHANGHELLLHVPLFDVVGGSIQSYLKSMLKPSSSSPSSKSPHNWPATWQLLNGLGPALCVLLDDVDHSLDSGLLEQVQEILNGRLFPGATVVCTTSSDRISSSLQPSTTLFKCGGLSWPQITRLVGNAHSAAADFLSQLKSCATRMELAGCPTTLALMLGGWEEQKFALGRWPPTPGHQEEASTVYSAIIHTLVNSSSSSPTKRTSPPKLHRLCEQLGRAFLHRNASSGSEYYGTGEGGLLSNVHEAAVKAGILVKCAGNRFRLVHWRLREYLIATYLAMASGQPQHLFRKELDLLLLRARDRELVPVLRILVQLLCSGGGHGQGLELLFSSINVLDLHLQSFLSIAPASSNAASLYYSHLSRLLTRHRLHSTTVYDSSWSGLISSPHCPLDSIDLQLRPQELAAGLLGSLFESLVVNTSIKSVKLSCVPGTEWTGHEIHTIAKLLLSLCTEKTLEALSIHFTLLSDREHGLYQPLVDVLSFCIANGLPSGLRSLKLELDLGAGQLWQLAEAFATAEAATSTNSGLETLHLPNLCIEREGGDSEHDATTAQALGRLLSCTGVKELSLQGCWRAVSPAASSTATGTETKSSYSLQRLSGHTSSSLLRFTQPPSPSANSEPGGGYGYGYAATATEVCLLQPVLYSSSAPSTISSLNLSKSSLSMADLHSLSSNLRSPSCRLSTLCLEGSRLVDVMHVLLALDSNTSLRELRLASNHVLLSDESIARIATVLLKNRALQRLSVAGWHFHIEDPGTLTRLTGLAAAWQLESLDMSGCRFDIKCPLPTPAAATPSSTTGTLKKGLKLFSSTLQLNLTPPSGTLSTLLFPRLAEALFGAVVVNWPRGRESCQEPLQTQILNSLASRANGLRILDLSVPAAEAGGAASLQQPAPLSSKTYVKLLKQISSGCTRLESLTLSNYRLRAGSERELVTTRDVLQRLQGLRTLCLDGTEVECGDEKAAGGQAPRAARRDKRPPRVDNWLMAPVLAGLNSGGATAIVAWTGFAPLQTLGRCLTEYDGGGGELELRLRGATVDDLRKLIASATTGSLDYGGEDGGSLVLIVKRAAGAGGGLLRGIRRLF